MIEVNFTNGYGTKSYFRIRFDIILLQYRKDKVWEKEQQKNHR